jgi:hypothetical protein
MNADDLPGTHIQLVFAAMLYRGDLISARGFRREAVSAFGSDTGNDLADRLLRLFTPALTHP